jgi:RNase P/RNase MRP subunit p29
MSQEQTSQDVQTATGAADTVSNTNQATADNQPARVYTQAELDALAAEVRRKAEAKYEKKFGQVDVEKYQTLLQKEEEQKISQAKEKSEFEKLLKENAEKFQSKIGSLTSELTKIKVDGALINAASTKRAVNPEQVARLVRENVKMSETGEVEVIDPKTGQTRYTDNGDPLTIDGLVGEFLQTNPHFVSAGQPGGGSKSNTGTQGIPQVDVNSLDMTNPEHRKKYAEYRKTQGY